MTGSVRIRVPRRRFATPLVWIERALFAAGLLLAIWCGVVLIEAEYIRRQPIPEPVHPSASVSFARAELPGELVASDDVRPESRARSGVAEPAATGAWVARLESSRLGLIATVLEGNTRYVMSYGAPE